MSYLSHIFYSHMPLYRHSKSLRVLTRTLLAILMISLAALLLALVLAPMLALGLFVVEYGDAIAVSSELIK